MNLADSLKLAPYITALTNGLIVQRLIPGDFTVWEDIKEDHEWDLTKYRYRIKTQPVLGPYEKEEDLIGLVGRPVRVRSLRAGHIIVRTVSSVIREGDKWFIHVSFDGAKYTPQTFFRKYEYTDGSPCGAYRDEVVHTPVKKKAGVPDEDFEEDEEPEDDIDSSDDDDDDEGGDPAEA